MASKLTESAAGMGETKRRCWECIRRRLVCDFTRPVCHKCRTTGIVCPGYEDRKPLTWLAPGKVTSRTRRKNRPASLGNSLAALGAASSNRPKVEVDHKTKAPQSGNQDAHNITVPRGYLKTETADIVQAAYYYNSQIFPSYKGIQLNHTPFLMPLESLHLFPSSMLYNLISMVLVHHSIMHTTGENGCWHRILRHRGNAIRALNDEIGKENRFSDANVSSVLVMLCAELQQGFSDTWLYHMNAIKALLSPRGGPREVIRTAPHMKLPIFVLVIIDVMSHTTSPPSSQKSALCTPDMRDIVEDLYEICLYPNFPCPRSLFTQIMRINDLRFRAVQYLPSTSATSKEVQRSEALTLLNDIISFSPHTWAETHTSLQDEWLLLAKIFHSAVLLYCILSLSSLSILPLSTEIQSTLEIHGNSLLQHLKKARGLRKVKFCLMWPLVVTAVHVACSTNTDAKTFLEGMLDEVTKEQGYAVPFMAKNMLCRFWAGDKTRWDDCFDRAYAFVV